MSDITSFFTKKNRFLCSSAVLLVYHSKKLLTTEIQNNAHYFMSDWLKKHSWLEYCAQLEHGLLSQMQVCDLQWSDEMQECLRNKRFHQRGIHQLKNQSICTVVRASPKWWVTLRLHSKLHKFLPQCHTNFLALKPKLTFKQTNNFQAFCVFAALSVFVPAEKSCSLLN